MTSQASAVRVTTEHRITSPEGDSILVWRDSAQNTCILQGGKTIVVSPVVVPHLALVLSKSEGEALAEGGND